MAPIAVQKTPQDLPSGECNIHRVHTRHVPLLHVRSAFEQVPHANGVVAASRNVKGALACNVEVVRVGSERETQPYARDVSLGARDLKRRFIIHICSIDVDPGVKTETGTRNALGNVEGPFLVKVRAMHLAATFQEKAYTRVAARHAGEVQRRAVRTVYSIDLGPKVQQNPRARLVPFSARPVKRRVVDDVLLVYRCIVFAQPLHAAVVAPLGSFNQREASRKTPRIDVGAPLLVGRQQHIGRIRERCRTSHSRASSATSPARAA